MPKMKTNRSAAKRFKVTGSGKLKRKRCGLRHNLEKRLPGSKKTAVKADYVHAADHARMMRMLPGA